MFNEYLEGIFKPQETFSILFLFSFGIASQETLTVFIVGQCVYLANKRRKCFTKWKATKKKKNQQL